MKIDRLLSIVILLMNRRIVQAKELAEMFEVSIRTIYRDIEVINQAGIPIVTYQGANGGIGLMEGYRLDRHVMSNDELAAIVTALRSVSSSFQDKDNQLLVEKINSIIPPAYSDQFSRKTQQFIVDFSPWGASSQLEHKLNLLKEAIELQGQVTFTYCKPDGEQLIRTIEPYTLVLKQQRWYLYGYCTRREQFRLFKLVRMRDLVLEQTTFQSQDIDMPHLPWNKEWGTPAQHEPIVLRFSSQAKPLAEEWFGVEELTPDERGGYVVVSHFAEDQWLYGFILGFGDQVEVLEPLHLRKRIRAIATRIAEQYRNDYEPDN